MLNREVDRARPDALHTLNKRLASVGSDWSYYPRDSLAGRIHELLAERVLKRRFSSLCFGTVQTPQSSGLSTEDAVMSPRDVARAARLSIDIAQERLRQSEALLVFGEGTRSRDRGRRRMLAGATRYLDVPGTWVLPMGIAGTEALFPVGVEKLHPSEIRIAPIEVEMPWLIACSSSFQR